MSRRIETERELENRRVVLQEREMALREKQYVANLERVIYLEKDPDSSFNKIVPDF